MEIITNQESSLLVKVNDDFTKWWYDEGSMIAPDEDMDCEEFAKSIAKIAWSNGAFKALSTKGDER